MKRGAKTVFVLFCFVLFLGPLWNEPFDWPIINIFETWGTSQHWSLLHQAPHIFPLLLNRIDQFLWHWKHMSPLQMFFKLQKERNNVWGFYSLWVIDCSLTSLLYPDGRSEGHQLWEYINRGISPCWKWWQTYAHLPFLHNEVLSLVPSFILKNGDK